MKVYCIITQFQEVIYVFFTMASTVSSCRREEVGKSSKVNTYVHALREPKSNLTASMAARKRMKARREKSVGVTDGD